MADRMRLNRAPTTLEPHSLESVYYVYGKSEQKAFGNSEHMPAEKYARVPDSVLWDVGLSLAARCVYGLLARFAFQGTTVRIGQRRIAKL